jgi:hypothetical protein
MLVSTASPVFQVSKKHCPSEPAAWQSARADLPTNEAYYGFADEAAEDAASAAELAAAASLAADAAESAADVAGGVVSGVGAVGASVLLPQALKMTAATKALRASLVFIYRYPENFD